MGLERLCKTIVGKAKFVCKLLHFSFIQVSHSVSTFWDLKRREQWYRISRYPIEVSQERESEFVRFFVNLCVKSLIMQKLCDHINYYF